MSIITSIISKFRRVIGEFLKNLALSLISILGKFITGLPSLPGRIGALASESVGKLAELLIEGLSTGLSNLGDFAENIVNTIVESISSSVQVGSAITSPLTLGVSGAVGLAISEILEFIRLVK